MPTIRRCCIVGCLSNSRQSPQLQFFQFPKPENPFHKMWKQACHASLSRIIPFKKPVVCALHFHPNAIGGRRLIASAVPSIRLEVPSNLKAVEQQAMVDEIERSRKCAYINAVVYEWLVRANLNPQLRGSITHGMIKEKADTACQLIGSTTFIADNRWLNRFRETHLNGFAQKLANNLLKPLGPSLWIPDIVQDLQHLFPPTSADRVANLETMPEQYLDYMQQYGEYEEEDDQDSKQDMPYEEQQQQNHYQQQQQQQQHPHHHSQGGYDPYGQQSHYSAGGYDDYYYNERKYQMNNYPSPHQQQSPASRSPPQPQPQQLPQPLPQPPQQTLLQSQRPQQPSPAPTPAAVASPLHRASPQMMPSAAKRQRMDDDDDDVTIVANGNGTEQIKDLTNDCEAKNLKAKVNGTTTPNGQLSATPAPSPSPKPATNGQTNGHGATPKISSKELQNYAQALEYLKPLEDFALFKENFRAIGLISQLEVILRKGDRRSIITNIDE